MELGLKGRAAVGRTITAEEIARESGIQVLPAVADIADAESLKAAAAAAIT
jgi:hypothetical protein